MKQVLLLILLAALPFAAARADSLDLTNQYGTATITNAGIVSHGVELTGFNGTHSQGNHSLGSVRFQTGALTSGTILTGGTFSEVGSSFVVTGNGSQGVPKGTIFSGAFTGPIQWTLVSQHGQTYNFTLTGDIKGQLYTGRTVTGKTTQYITLYKNQWQIDNKGKATLGKTSLTTPEPGTLSMLGTGLLAVAGMFKRKFLS